MKSSETKSPDLMDVFTLADLPERAIPFYVTVLALIVIVCAWWLYTYRLERELDRLRGDE